MAATEPRLLVELGVYTGVSFSAFCEAVLRSGGRTQLLGVDTWKGDVHTGLYDENVYADFAAFHAARYARISSLRRCTFRAALAIVPDGSIDFLHIDGSHTLPDVREDYESWLPKLSRRAIILFHDTEVRGGGFGVWQLWYELRSRFPHFEFVHAHGLGVLGHGANLPEAMRRLCELPGQSAAQLRELFAAAGAVEAVSPPSFLSRACRYAFSTRAGSSDRWVDPLRK